MAVDPFFQQKGFADITAALLKSVQEPSAGRPPLTDATEGSVVLTLVEAFARELAVCYEQLGIVYRCAYLDTAEGPALDHVVALLGIERHNAGFLAGTVEFSRGQPADADITIPAGTLVAGPQAAGQKVPPFQTLKDTVLSRGARLVRADVQSVEPGGDVKLVPAHALTVMPRPVSGIETVANPGRMIQRQAAETDDELRARSRQIVRGANTGTVGALGQAVRSCGVEGVKVVEDPAGNPGEVAVVFDTADIAPDDKQNVFALIHARVAAVRPAGVRVSVGLATTIAVRVAATLQLAQELSPADQQDILGKTVAALKAYFAQLAIGESVRAAKVRSVLASDPRVVAIAAAPDGAPFMDPLVDGVSVRKRMTYDDIPVGSNERAMLDATDPWPRLALESPGVRIDAVLMMPSGTDPVVAATFRKAATDGLTARIAAKVAELDRAEKAGSGDSGQLTIFITYDELAVAAQSKNFTSARFTVVHERDGHAVTLAAGDDQDSFAKRERPRLGSVVLSVGTGAPHG